MLNQPSNITPDEINGTGTVDITQDLTVSWRVSGSSAMTDYQIVFYENNAASTQVYTTGKVTLGTPFWGVNYAGVVQYFSVVMPSATLTSAGMSNGNEYKMLITQWWGAESVAQLTASIFITRDIPTLVLGTVADPLTDNEATFTATYSQAQGDPIRWVRWQIAYADAEGKENPFLDTGNIYGTGELQVSYDGFLTGTAYSVKCTVETANGVDITTDWNDFNVDYTLPSSTGDATACQVQGDAGVWVSWERNLSADGYTIMRKERNENRLIKITDVASTAGQIRDYSAKSGCAYTYYIFPTGSLAYLSEPMVTNEVAVQYWFWAIVEASSILGGEELSVERTYLFRYSVSEGAMNNNNAPQISQNFTRFPTRQGVNANYMTGTLTGYIGTIDREAMTYSDSAAQAQAIMNLSSTTNALFLLDPKGNFRRIHTSAATSLQIDHKKWQMPQTMTVSWVEVGATNNIHPVMYPGEDYYPVDRVIFSTIGVNISTGALEWTVPDNYSGTGSMLTLNNNGELVQDDSGSFLPATITLDSDTMVLTAEVSE